MSAADVSDQESADEGSYTPAVSERDLFAELPFYVGRPEPDLINCPQTRDGETLKNPHWLAMRPPFSASECGTVVGLNPYPNGSPEFRYRVKAGITVDEFNGNADTEFGELHEPRLRGIFRAVTGIGVTEYGLFIDNVHRWQGVSPDGVTQPVRLSGMLSDGKTPFSWLAGTCMLEAKCSIRHFYDHPQAMHLCQLHLQMWVRGTNAGFLIYWNGKDGKENVRIWFVVFSDAFSKWKRLRMCLMRLHVEKQVPVDDRNPFFNDKHFGFNRLAPWAGDPKDRRNWNTGLAYEMHERYFYKDISPKFSRQAPPLSMQLWQHELSLLGMTQQDWDAIPGFADLSPTRCRAVLDFIPASPEIYLVYETTRVVTDAEKRAEDRTYIQPVPEEDEEFFDCEYMKMQQYNSFLLARMGRGVDIDAHRPKYNIKRLFVTGVEIVPAVARPDLPDMFGIFRDDESRELYERRLVKEEARFAKKMAERAAAANFQKLLDEAHVAPLRQMGIMAGLINMAAAPRSKRPPEMFPQPRAKWTIVERAAGDNTPDPFDQPEGPLRSFYPPRSPDPEAEPEPNDQQQPISFRSDWDEAEDGPCSPLIGGE